MKKYVEEFIKYALENNLPIEAILLANKNDVICSYDFCGYPDRNIYSHTKSFTSTMVGIAIDEGKLHLNDKIVPYFKDEITKEQYEEYKDVTIEDLLTMRLGQKDFDLDVNVRTSPICYPSFVKYIFSKPLIYKPGTTFVYNNSCSHLLSVILTKIYKKPLINLVYERILRVMDIPYPVWEADPEGYSFGASGLRLSILNMNKLGRLYLNNGNWNGIQIVSEKWVKMCSIMKVIPEKCDGWNKYSYQFWSVPYDNGYKAEGAFGQTTMIFPSEDYALSYQCPERGNHDLIKTKINEIILEPYFNAIKSSK